MSDAGTFYYTLNPDMEMGLLVQLCQNYKVKVLSVDPPVYILMHGETQLDFPNAYDDQIDTGARVFDDLVDTDDGLRLPVRRDASAEFVDNCQICFLTEILADGRVAIVVGYYKSSSVPLEGAVIRQQFQLV